jgi:hypothetical protein
MNWFLFATVLLYIGASMFEARYGSGFKSAIYASFAVTNSILTFWRLG